AADAEQLGRAGIDRRIAGGVAGELPFRTAREVDGAHGGRRRRHSKVVGVGLWGGARRGRRVGEGGVRGRCGEQYGCLDPDGESDAAHRTSRAHQTVQCQSKCRTRVIQGLIGSGESPCGMADVQPMANPPGSAATSCSVRRAREENLAEINRVIVASESRWDYPAAYLEAALPLLTIEGPYLTEHLCLEIVDEQAPVVCFFAVAEDGGEHLLDHLWVRPDRLGQGIGRAACEHVFALARRHGWAALPVLPDPPAQGFYRKV